MTEQTQTVSGAQLEQAIGTIIRAVKWSEPPKSDTVAPGDFHTGNAHALQIVIMCAREAMKQQTPADQADIPHIPLETADANMNGDGAT